MTSRHFPVRPNLDQLKHQAKDLLRGVQRGDPDALAELSAHVSKDPAKARLADAQLALARSYGIPSWPRLVLSCKLVDAIWRDDAKTLRALFAKHPRLLHESALVRESNWGPPMSYAANLGRQEIIALLRDLGADDVQHAFERACLQGQLDAARQLYAMGARPVRGSVMGPCETLNPDGLALLLELGAEFCDAAGDRLAPVALLLQTYSRGREGKHRCLEIAAGLGVELPDTATMAMHRGRIDLLEKHLPQLLGQTFSHQEIYPPALGCSSDHSLALHGTPLAGATLLHMCIDYDEREIARWLLDRGADVNAKAAIDEGGFGGHTALFNCVVSQAWRAGLHKDAGLTQLLLDRGADVNARASLRKRLRFTDDDALHEVRDVTPLQWGRRFHDQAWVNPLAMKLIADRGGR